MHVTLVDVRVKPEHITDFIQATRANHMASVSETGNLRFDVLQSPDDSSRFMLYEAYVSADAAAAHKQTVHYLHWRDSVASWMEAPRVGTAYHGLFPQVSRRND